jgi:hypothetical protein
LLHPGAADGIGAGYAEEMPSGGKVQNPAYGLEIMIPPDSGNGAGKIIEAQIGHHAEAPFSEFYPGLAGFSKMCNELVPAIYGNMSQVFRLPRVKAP